MSTPGRKPIRGRVARTVRIPEVQLERYIAEQLKGGYDSLGSYLVAVLAEAHDLPVPAYITEQRRAPAPESNLFTDLLNAQEVA